MYGYGYGYQPVPQTGLIGSEQALQGGLRGGLGALLAGYGQGRGDLMSGYGQGRGDLMGMVGLGAGAIQGGTGAANMAFDRGANNFDSFLRNGQRAQGLQAAYSGAMGADAQQRAYNNFIESPGQAWLREQGERAVTRNAAAMGGLGGGRVMQELQRQGQGLAAQDFDAHFARLAGLSDQGLMAAQGIGQLRGMQGNMNANSGLAMADLYGNAGNALGNMGMNMGNALGDMGLSAGQYGAGMFQDTGTMLAAGRTNAGNAIANNIAGVTAGLSDLANQQGRGMAGLNNEYANQLANLLTGSGAANADMLNNLANYLANINQGAAGIVGGVPGMPGVQPSGGFFGESGKFLGQGAGIQSLLGGFGSGMGSGIAAGIMSDIRLKTNIRRIGSTAGGTAIYRWDWNDEGARIAGDQPTVGVIAQEVPWAAFEGPDGYLRVDYGRVA